MRTVCLWTIMLLTILLAGCKNRFETYEPYSEFDARMNAAEMGRPYPAPPPPPPQYGYYNDPYAAQDDEGYYADEPRSPRRMAQPQKKSFTGDPNAEVPFSSSRSEKHAANIGAM